MDIVVPMKFVPDLVDDLEIDDTTEMLDRSFLRLVPNELDEHALEEALLLKERHGGSVTVVCLDTGDVDDTLFTAIAKGADRVIKLNGEDFDEAIGSRAFASIVAETVRELPCDLILCGTQAVDDLDGFSGPYLAARLGLPYVGYVIKVEYVGLSFVLTKEYPGGITSRVAADGPAVVGIQAAEQPPRYVVTSLVMDAMKNASIDARDTANVLEELSPAGVKRMRLPETTTHAEMLEGDVEQVAELLVAALRDRGALST